MFCPGMSRDVKIQILFKVELEYKSAMVQRYQLSQINTVDWQYMGASCGTESNNWIRCRKKRPYTANLLY